MLDTARPTRTTAMRIVRNLCDEASVEFSDVMGRCRRGRVVPVRAQAIHDIWVQTGWTWSAIGRIFGIDNKSAEYLAGRHMSANGMAGRPADYYQQRVASALRNNPKCKGAGQNV